MFREVDHFDRLIILRPLQFPAMAEESWRQLLLRPKAVRLPLAAVGLYRRRDRWLSPSVRLCVLWSFVGGFRYHKLLPFVDVTYSRVPPFLPGVVLFVGVSYNLAV